MLVEYKITTIAIGTNIVRNLYSSFRLSYHWFDFNISCLILLNIVGNYFNITLIESFSNIVTLLFIWFLPSCQVVVTTLG